jgi:hypothetical protein
MKKLYFLNEEEKERILKLHENSTSRQYLSEADAGAVLTGLALGGIGGAALAYMNSSGGSADGVKKLFGTCSQSGVGKSTMDGGTLDGIASGVRAAVSGWGTDEDAIKTNLSKIQTIPDLCAVITRYAENYPGSTLLGDLDGDIDSDSEWNEYVYQPLLAAKRKSAELGGKKGGGITGAIASAASSVVEKVKPEILKLQPNWSKYNCIFNHPQAKPGKMSNGSWAITIGNSVYYDNGRYKAPDGTMKSYTCPGTTGAATGAAATTKAATTTKVAAKPSGPSPVTTSNIKQIQKIVGVAETGVFDDATKAGVKTKLGIK